ncbi:MAG: GNAT family N-acetyltransferase [Acidimicrobiales bacterium]
MPRQRLGIALLVPQPLATEIDGLRRALGAAERALVAPHLTLVSPTNVRDDDVPRVLATVRSEASKASPLQLHVGPVASFAPVTPTVHLLVSGDVEPLASLRAAVRVGPLDRPQPYTWVPHVTLAQEVPPERIEPAVAALADYRADCTINRVHVLRQDPDKVWRPIADYPFEQPAVVGRGGVELDLTFAEEPDLEAATLATGRPLVVTARRAGEVVGVARFWVAADGDTTLLDLVVAEGHRGQGISRQLRLAGERLPRRWRALIRRVVPDRDRITSDWVVAPPLS